MIEPIVGVLFIAAPWIFGFSDASDATTDEFATDPAVGVRGGHAAR